MAHHFRKLFLFLLVASALVLISVVPSRLANADVHAQAGQTKTLDRDKEPVIVKGLQVPALDGAPVGELYVYTFDDDTLNGPILAQVDEVADGSYVASEDGYLDGDDEIVFMAKDLGDQPSDTSALSSLPISPDWYEIEVTDPITGNKGWAYLVRRSPVSVGGYYVQYSAGNRRVSTSQYELGFANQHLGFDYLALGGGNTNILDRTKIRVSFDVWGVPVTLDENDLENPEIVLVKGGPVRVILRQDVSAEPGGPVSEASLTTTNLAYDSLVQATATTSFTLPSYVGITRVRTSVDLNSAASGATFYNAYTPGGVTIDGSPETVAETPLSNWVQVSHTTGRLIQVADPTPVGGTQQKNYYCDDNTAVVFECDGTQRTGDNGSYGDVGISIEGDVNQTFTLETWLFFLSPPNGGQDNVGTTCTDYFFNRLKVAASLRGERPPVYLPLIFKNSRY